RDSADEHVARAVRGALLGDAEVVATAARLRRAEEERLASAAFKPESLAENIMALATATRRPTATTSELRSSLSDHSKDKYTQNLDRLLRRISPRQRFLEAGKDRRYVAVRRAYNSLAQPIFSAAQGQFFPLLSLPFDLLDGLFVGSRFLSPEQRR